MDSCLHLYIRGQVVGVGFRAFTKNLADRYGLGGFVRNVHHKPEIFGPEGGVEAEVQGETDSVHAFVKGLRNGPGKVTDIVTQPASPGKPYTSFDILF